MPQSKDFPPKLSSHNLTRDNSLSPQKNEHLVSTDRLNAKSPDFTSGQKMMKDESVMRIDAPSIITEDSNSQAKKKVKIVSTAELRKELHGKHGAITISKHNLITSPLAGRKDRLTRLLELSDVDPNLGISDSAILSSIRGSGIYHRVQ